MRNKNVRDCMLEFLLVRSCAFSLRVNGFCAPAGRAHVGIICVHDALRPSDLTFVARFTPRGKPISMRSVLTVSNDAAESV